MQDLKIERLERLNRLRESGALTQEEFEAEKAAVLAGSNENWSEDKVPGSRTWLLVAALIAAAVLAILAWSQFGDSPQPINQPAGKPAVKAAERPAPSPLPTTTKTPTADPLAIVSKQWLIGGWIPAGQDCASDGGVIYNSDGTYSSWGQIGTWKLQGKTIVSIETEHMGDDGEWQKLPHPVRSTERFLMAKKDEYRTVDGDGERYHNRRCKDANVR